MSTDVKAPDTGADSISPEFRNKAPVIDLDKLLPPLTPEQESEVDRFMTGTPEYQQIMESCRDLKTHIVESAAQSIAILEMMRDGDIPKENLPEALELLKASAGLLDASKETLMEINTALSDADLPPGDCELKTPGVEGPKP